MYRTVYPERIDSLIQYDNYILNIGLSGIIIIEYTFQIKRKYNYELFHTKRMKTWGDLSSVHFSLLKYWYNNIQKSSSTLFIVYNI
jgi:hypothetical protein